MRSMGRAAAAAVVLGDIGKGVAAAALGDLAAGEAAGFAAGAAAVIGHCWPVWHRFRGGKGVAAAAGMTLWLEPQLGIGMLVLWGVLVAITKRASVASLVVVAVFVPGLVATGHRDWSLVWAALVAVVVAARHRHNVKRLLEGSEHTLEADSA
jgi:glycerol-3-phosphate acyltransferase PlsY